MGAWRRLDAKQAAHLVPARLELHRAAQLAAAPGTSLLPALADHGHTNLGWSPPHDALLGRRLPSGLRAGLRPRDLTLLVVADDVVLAERPLAGRTFAQALDWLATSLEEHALAPLAPIAPPAHPLPDHPTAHGEPFTGASGGGLAAICDWLADAHQLLVQLRADHPSASEPRCWPHHFDLASLIAIDGERSIGVGMTPGDAGEATPYFYVTPWPYPADREALPGLPAGARWNTEGWVGALLPGTALESDPATQRAQARAFVDAGIDACRALL